MRVKYVMTRNVVAGRVDTSVEDAKELLRLHHISGLPVLDADGVVVGVFSQTDALHRVGHLLGDLMTSPAVTVDEETSIRDVAAIMAAKDINRVPVVSQGRLVGIISRADVVRYVATHHAWDKAERHTGRYSGESSSVIGISVDNEMDA